MTGHDVLHQHCATGGASAHLTTPAVAQSVKCRWWMNENRSEVQWCWRQSRRTRTKTCYSATLPTTTLEWTGLGSNPSLRNESSATNRLSHGTPTNRLQALHFHPSLKTGCYWILPAECQQTDGQKLLHVPSSGSWLWIQNVSSVSEQLVRNT